MKSYLKFLSRNKVYTFISIIGLAVSLTFVILIGDYTWRQMTVDAQHPDADRIYIVGSNNSFYSWPQIAQELEEVCPEVEQTCRIFSQCGKIRSGKQEVKNDEGCIMMFTDPTFFSFFDFRLKEGDLQSALNAPDKCVITESLAQQLFNGKNPIGETLQLIGNRGVRISSNDPYDSTLVYNIAGIVEDLDRTVLPNETQVIVSMERYPQVLGYQLDRNMMAYGATGYCKTMLKLKPNSRVENVRQIADKHIKENYPTFTMMDMGDVTITPLREIMFAPQNSGRGTERGDGSRLHILLAAVLAILFFAVSNYINLTVANTSFRAKEMATRRLFGGTGIQISLKLIGESVLMVAVAFAIGLALAFCFEQDAASLFQGKIALKSDVSIGTVTVCCLFILLTGICSGLLPTWHLSRFQPIDIVKGSFRFHSKMLLSRVFIVLQNVITVVMLSASLVIWLQLRHIIQAPLGFNTDNLYMVVTPESIESQSIRSRLEQMPLVEQIGCWCGSTFTDGMSSWRSITRDEKLVNVCMTILDSTALKLYGLNILKDYGPSSDGYYLTEEAMRLLELNDSDRVFDFGAGSKSPLNGVIADIHRINVLNDVMPHAIQVKKDVPYPNFLVKVNHPGKAKAALSEMLTELGCPASETDEYVQSATDVIRESVADRENTLRIISLFALVAIVISVMGFVGLSLFFIRQRKKEIGIRKIMGSSSAEVLWLMLRTFCMPLLVSFVVAIPIAYYVMSHWLEDFSYRISLSPWIFVATCLFSLLTAILSVSFQIGRAVRTNPVESIQVE